MKAGLLSIAALSAVAVAQPQHGAHRHRHAKKDVVTEVSYVTATAPADVVYVDQFGNKISGGQSQETQAPAPPAYSAPQQDQAPPASSYEAPAPPAYSAPAYSAPASSASQAQQSSAPASSSAPSADSVSEGSGLGITYSPYNSDKTCKTADQIAEDLATIDGYSMIRMYGTDCDQTGPIMKAAKSKNMKVMAGLFDIKDVDSQIETLKAAVASDCENDWSVIDTVSVGNEGVNNGQYSVSDVKAAVNAAKSALPSDFKGSVVTVDTFIAVINNPDLCSVGDYTAVNCHAYFDGGVTAEKSGQWVLEQAQHVSEACGNPDRKVVITEAGWPSKGQTHGQAVPSSENQQAAVKDLKSVFTSNLFLFSAYNDYWKQNSADTYGVEAYWGIYGDCPSSH